MRSFTEGCKLSGTDNTSRRARSHAKAKTDMGSEGKAAQAHLRHALPWSKELGSSVRKAFIENLSLSGGAIGMPATHCPITP